ncbi:MAG TPA: RNB domain-containing ribonuclease, partial [Minicystis sp.]|nr:RNB domain-containing ribonuclease [Minicystis sp.]
KRLSQFLKKIQAHPQKQVFHMLLLRAMRQAVYDVANKGHFGLASEAYLHFTSPIRRYPDLVVHRAVRQSLRGEATDRSGPALERLRNAASLASETERKAMEIEREVVDLDRALYMRSRVGEVFEGTVTGLVGSGVFVQVDDPFVDVLVRTEALGLDDYDLDDEGLRMIGRRSGDRIGLGDAMLVAVEDVAVLRRTVYGRRLADPDALRPKKKDKRGRRGETERPAREARAKKKGRSTFGRRR